MKLKLKSLLAMLLALGLFLTPVLADEGTPLAAEPEAQQTAPTFSSVQQKDIIYEFAHYLANNYFYGISDNNLLYSVICATIDNNGQFDLDVALKAMVDILGDEYAEYYSPESFVSQTEYFNASFFGIGAVFTVHNGGTIIDSIMPGGSAEAVGLKAGDIIIAVDGVDTTAMVPAQVRERVVGEANTTVEITVLRGEDTLTFTPIRQKVSESHSTMEILENNIAYIDVSSFTASLPSDFDGYIAEMNSLGINKVIIDLRDNGGGDLNSAISVAQKLIPAGVIGKIKTSKNGAVVEDVISENTDVPAYDILVLVNENTASASEFLAMALQSKGRGKLLGEHTYGKGCMQAMLRAPTGSGLKFTIGEYFTCNDERIHTVGLTPDFPVENVFEPINREDFTRIDFMDLSSEASRLGVEERFAALGLIPYGEVDGVFNSYTEAAIRAFQLYYNLESTGTLDFYTALYLNDQEFIGLEREIDVQMQEALKYFER